MSVHGDSLVFEPDRQIGLKPLAVTSTIPNPGDRVWLLAPAGGTDGLVHAGRWLGSSGDWYHYRLDEPTLAMAAASGGALLNVEHEVIGIQVAVEESGQGTIAIASPIQSIIYEIQ